MKKGGFGMKDHGKSLGGGTRDCTAASDSQFRSLLVTNISTSVLRDQVTLCKIQCKIQQLNKHETSSEPSEPRHPNNHQAAKCCSATKPMKKQTDKNHKRTTFLSASFSTAFLLLLWVVFGLQRLAFLLVLNRTLGLIFGVAGLVQLSVNHRRGTNRRQRWGGSRTALFLAAVNSPENTNEGQSSPLLFSIHDKLYVVGKV